MPLRFYNTLTQQVEDFAPARDNTVRMYTCGPTVYDFAHIGNLRTFTFVDILRRWLRARGFALDHVMNITDVDDQIIQQRRRAQAESLEEYTGDLHRGVPGRLRPRCGWSGPSGWCAPPSTSRTWPQPSGGWARRATPTRATAPIYFRIAKFPEYGKLSHTDFSGMQAGRARGYRQVRKGRRARLRAVEGAQGRRAVLGNGDRRRAAGLAHRVLRDGDEVPGRDARHPRRRRRPDLPAPRERDRAVGSAHRQAVRALLAALGAPAGGRRRRCRSRWATSSRCATCWSGATRRRRSATCWPRCPTASS